jgi:hypothetical protein
MKSIRRATSPDTTEEDFNIDQNMKEGWSMEYPSKEGSKKVSLSLRLRELQDEFSVVTLEVDDRNAADALRSQLALLLKTHPIVSPVDVSLDFANVDKMTAFLKSRGLSDEEVQGIYDDDIQHGKAQGMYIPGLGYSIARSGEDVLGVELYIDPVRHTGLSNNPDLQKQVVEMARVASGLSSLPLPEIPSAAYDGGVYYEMTSNRYGAPN